MGWLSMATRKELAAAAGVRYRRADRAKKARILDEFVDITGFHRKHVMRLLRNQEGVFHPDRRATRRKGLGVPHDGRNDGRRRAGSQSEEP